MNLSALNQMITPLANAEIKTCDLKSMDFHIIGHEKQSATTMTLLYNDLEVTLVKPTMSGEKERKFISGIINTFFLKSNNPDRNGTRHAKTTTERTLTRSQWNYLWKSLFGGVKETAGIGEK